MPTPTEPGWYPDPEDPTGGSIRWWNGRAWTGEFWEDESKSTNAGPSEPASAPRSASPQPAVSPADGASAPKTSLPTGIKILIGVAIGALSFFLLLILAAIAVPVLLASSNPADRAEAESNASALQTLVGAEIAIEGSLTPLDNATFYESIVGSMSVPEGTMDVTGTGKDDYCVSVTIGNETAAYGPGAVAPDEPCQP